MNLKKLNENVEPIHFKMENFKNVLQIIKPNCWLASVDLKSAYYSIPIHREFQRYLKFYWDKPYVLIALPNSYTDGPRVFTKILKPPFAELRSMGYTSVIFLDDSILQDDSFE